MSRWKALAVAVLLVPMIGALRAQDEPKYKDSGKSTDQRMPTFEPTKEHQLLKQFDGDWEYTAKCSMPGMEPMEGKGTETARLSFGGFWLTCEEKGMMKDKEFTGQGFIGYNPHFKKFTGVWIDNHSPFMGKFVGEADSSGKVFTFKFMMTEEQQRTWKAAKEAEESGKKAAGKEYGKDTGKEKETGKEMGKEMGGMKCPDKMVHEIKDQDHRTLKFYGKDDSGKEQLWTEITFTRKPAMIK
jgi:hypothetical protein